MVLSHLALRYYFGCDCVPDDLTTLSFLNIFLYLAYEINEPLYIRFINYCHSYFIRNERLLCPMFYVS